MTRRAAGLCVLLTSTALACEDESFRDIRADIVVVTERDDVLVAPAMTRLVAYGRAAVPQMETALHIARTAGRERLIDAMGRIGDPDILFILRHVAVFDVDASVRTEAERVIAGFAGGPGDERAAQARAAQSWILARRAAGHVPIARQE